MMSAGLEESSHLRVGETTVWQNIQVDDFAFRSLQQLIEEDLEGSVVIAHGKIVEGL